MVDLLGEHDDLLRRVEAAFPVAILVRGNEITLTGDPDATGRVARLFEELIVLVEQGHPLDRDGIDRAIAMVESDLRPSDVLLTEVVRGR
jgi:phosphate starvation-inducible PhoH-like protein